jgi:hypothetical protein
VVGGVQRGQFSQPSISLYWKPAQMTHFVNKMETALKTGLSNGGYFSPISHKSSKYAIRMRVKVPEHCNTDSGRLGGQCVDNGHPNSEGTR